MNHTLQDIYASNLLWGQNFGYPLRDPKPSDKFDLESLQIGDVGYINNYSEFKWLFNIRSLLKELLEGGIQNLTFNEPASNWVFDIKKVLMVGVKQTLEEPRYNFHVPLEV